MFKKIGEFFQKLWMSKKDLIKGAIFLLIDKKGVPDLEKILTSKKNEIIDALNKFSAKENALKVGKEVKDYIDKQL